MKQAKITDLLSAIRSELGFEGSTEVLRELRASLAAVLVDEGVDGE